MKARLAESLLAKVMGWSDEEVKAELTPLLLLAEVKYDEYHQFGPGMRFIERLARWLSQLKGDTDAESFAIRKVAFSIVKEHLIFISGDEMYSLIGLAYPEFVLPLQRKLVASSESIPPHRIAKIEASPGFRSLVTRTLYIGLSDGSQVGMLRRMNPSAIDHEFTLLNYDVTVEKASAIKDKLTSTLDGIGDANAATFDLVVLVDDFTASGTSFIRQEDSQYKGKLVKVVGMLNDGALSTLCDLPQVTLLVLFYVSTDVALSNIRTAFEAFLSTHGLRVNFIIDAVHTIPGDAMRVGASDGPLDAFLLERFKQFESSVVDEHYKKGDCSAAHRGFNSGDLAVVLFHNSPNNSLPVLWYEGPENVALFPRTTRHGRR